jgi:hypothetical protein
VLKLIFADKMWTQNGLDVWPIAGQTSRFHNRTFLEHLPMNCSVKILYWESAGQLILNFSDWFVLHLDIPTFRLQTYHWFHRIYQILYLLSFSVIKPTGNKWNMFWWSTKQCAYIGYSQIQNSTVTQLWSLKCQLLIHLSSQDGKTSSVNLIIHTSELQYKKQGISVPWGKIMVPHWQ